jgi:hypothetical protein
MKRLNSSKVKNFIANEGAIQSVEEFTNLNSVVTKGEN